MSDHSIGQDLGVIAWIAEFLVLASSTFKDASLGDVSIDKLTQLREKSAEFEAQVRSSFKANPRFVDQYFDKSDFAFNATLSEALLGALEEHLRSVADSFSVISSKPLSGFDASSSIAQQVLELINTYTNITKGVRNLSTQVHIRTKPHKTSYLPYLLEAPLELIRQAKDIKSAETPALMSSLLGLARSIFQLAANMSVQNSNPNLEVIYAHIFPAWVGCLELDASDQSLYGSLCAVLFNACRNDPMRICDFITDEEEFYRFISYYSSLHDIIKDDLDANMTHWFHLVCTKLWPHLGLVLSELGKHSKHGGVDPTQMFVLNVLDHELEQWVAENPNTEISEYFGDKFVLKVLESLTLQVERAEEILVRIGRNSSLAPTEPPTAEERPLVDYAWLALQTIASMSMALGATFKSQPESIHLVRSLIRVLGRGNAPAPSTEAEIKNSRIPAPADAVLGLKTLIIRSLANFSFGCKAAQDEVRTAEGIPLLLNGCKDDPFNPFIREWSLFACRNVCEQNEENQLLIANLKASGVMPSVELEEMGFKAVLEETGKVRIEKVGDERLAPEPSSK